ncbi:MAG TPA: (Fe-S)-binding protein [Rhodospirillaceae bacterium]|nr:(Fe-S)-binding protein [Rhodospirillaceae bacterium]
MAATDDFIDRLDDQVRGIVDACTACGACVRACPTPDILGIDAGDGAAVAAGVLDILKTGEGPVDAEEWAGACCGSGHCLTVCEHGINPRFMLTMARRAMTAARPAAERRAGGKDAFKAMSRGVRVLSRLQLSPDLMNRLSPSSHPTRETPPDIVFYTGCNMLKTPHIGLLCLDVFDRLGVSYEVYGGPSNCCGILQLRPGDTANAGRQAGRTMERFAETGAADVVSWCPTCQMQMTETLTAAPAAASPFDARMLPVFLASRLDDLKPYLTRPVNKRVALHEYPGSPGVVDAVKALLSAVPGVELVDLDHPGVGYQMSSLDGMPDVQQRHIAGTFRQAEAAGVDALAGVFHADHRELVGHQNEWPFEIVNYMELIGESMGLSRPDLFKRMKLMQDADAIMAEAADLIETHGLDPEEVRDVILSDIFGERKLPTDRSLHPAE